MFPLIEATILYVKPPSLRSASVNENKLPDRPKYMFFVAISTLPSHFNPLFRIEIIVE